MSGRPAKRARKEEVAQLETNCTTLGELLKSLAKTADGDPVRTLLLWRCPNKRHKFRTACFR